MVFTSLPDWEDKSNQLPRRVYLPPSSRGACLQNCLGRSAEAGSGAERTDLTYHIQCCCLHSQGQTGRLGTCVLHRILLRMFYIQDTHHCQSPLFMIYPKVLLSISHCKLCGVYKWNLHLVSGGCLWWEGATVADASGGALL